MATFLGKLAQVGVAGFLAWKALPQDTRTSIKDFTVEFLERPLPPLQLPPPPPQLALPPPQPDPEPSKLPDPNPLAEQAPDWRTRFAELMEAQSLPTAPTARTPLIMNDEPDRALRDVIPHPSVVLVVGKRGSGKSAFAYRLAELMKLKAQVFAVGVPVSARAKLPEWIGIVSTIEDLPSGSVAVIDEAYLHFHSRESMAGQGRVVSGFVNLSRQRDQTLIFVSQEARQLDRNIASSANVVVFKQPGMMQAEYERPELRHLAEQESEASEPRRQGRLWPHSLEQASVVGGHFSSNPRFKQETESVYVGLKSARHSQRHIRTINSALVEIRG